MTQPDSPLEEFRALSRQLTDLQNVLGTLVWDQETTMPPAGGPLRAGQVATLASLRHERLTSSRYGELIDEAERGGGDAWAQADVREARRVHEKACKLPADLVAELARTTSLAYDAWVEARRNSDFPAFAPWLSRILELKRREADCLGYEDTPYDALLDEYEEGTTEARLEQVFSELRPRLTGLLEQVLQSPRQPAPDLLRGAYPAERQEDFGRRILTAMGFDWDAGRLDRSPHPFCAGLTPRDVRITTRYSEEDFTMAVFGIIHEGGHALYEQGLDTERYGLPATATVSLGIHESQSRLWENMVGRSPAFWRFWYPILQSTFPGQLDLELEEFVRGINRVQAGLIRVDADEVSYGLHVILRFELERELLSGRLEVAGLEERWNELMQGYLGVKPPDAASGVLQDVHWSSGLFGYFPTYLIGTIYATQFYRQAVREISGLETSIGEGKLTDLKEWLGDRIHRQGKLYRAEELVRRVTGEPMNAAGFSDYLTEKYGALYAL